MDLKEKITPTETAIIVLDVQNDFCHKDGAFTKVLSWDASPIREMVPRLAAFVNEARSKGCAIIFTQMINDDLLSPANLRERLTNGAEREAGAFPFALQPKSWGWEIYDIKPREGDKIFEKQYYDPFSVPEAKEYLMAKGIKTLIVTGLYTQVCVLATAQRGFTEKFNVIIPKNLVSTVAEKSALGTAALKIMEGYCAEVTNAQTISSLWKSA